MNTLYLKNVLFVAGVLGLLGCVPPPSPKVVSSPVIETPIPDKAKTILFSWKPNLTKEDLDCKPLSIYAAISFSLESITDVRQDPRIVGKTLEDKKIQDVFVPLVTKINVGKWSQNAIYNGLRTMGCVVNEKKAKIRLGVELIDFSIEDNITQTGHATLQVTATTSGELLIWEGKVQGTSDLYYRPKESDGISECLSNTMLVTVHNLLIEQSFRDAVIKAFEIQ